MDQSEEAVPLGQALELQTVYWSGCTFETQRGIPVYPFLEAVYSELIN